ncbi:MAG: GDSL-type esterase/lipase family protein [Lentisphaeria bacterium]|jgi:lysophospholipase L1-like esterase|nr:GDSL-type esterase/lipase family protein [Lentisphaeria bacterium]
MNSRTLGCILVVVLLLGGCFGWVNRPAPKPNQWPIRNLPVGPGPIVCYGDSLVSGVGASSSRQTYPAQLGQLLGRPVQAQGTPGETTAGALASLRDGDGPKDAPLVVVTLGGNDILARTRLSVTEANLAEIFDLLHARGAVVAFTAIESPLSGQRGRSLAKLCRRHGVILVPDLLGDILGEDELMADPIHPNDAGYAIVAERIATALRPFL